MCANPMLSACNYTACREESMARRTTGVVEYVDLQEMSSHGDIPGYLHDNDVCSKCMHEARADDPDIEGRMCKPHELGFESTIYTPQSKMAGAVRSFVMGVALRIVSR